MTPIEISYFKHFLYDRGMERSYQYFYRSKKSRIDTNPEEIEKFFLQTSREDVIMKAFLFKVEGENTRTDYTYSYWKDIDDKWQEYMRQNDDNKINDSWPMLRKTFAILRQNWDAPEYWKKENFESTEEVYQRMNINLPLPENCWQHGTQSLQRPDAELIKFKIFDAKDGDIIVRVKKCDSEHTLRLIILFRELQPCEIDGIKMYKALTYAHYNCTTGRLKIGGETRSILVNPNSREAAFRLAFDAERSILMEKLADVGLKWSDSQKTLVSKDEDEKNNDSERPAIPSQEEDNGLGINFVEFDKNCRVVNALNRGIISVNTKYGHGRITINRIDTKEIKRKNVKYAMVGNTASGDTMLMLCNNDNGIQLTYNGDNYYNINSKQFVGHLKRLLSISEDLVYLRIEKVSEKIDSIIYKVTKQ